MVILFEGIDNVGKSTQITKIQPLLIDKPLHVLHYSAIKGFKTNEEVKAYSDSLYRSMFSLLEDNYKHNHFILDRSHIGEVVYSPMYRGYDGSYVYDIEKWYTETDMWQQIYLITFIDDAENVIKRDDGLSFTIELEKKKKEIQAFVDATLKSNIIHKKIINISGKDIETVFSEIKAFLEFNKILEIYYDKHHNVCYRIKSKNGIILDSGIIHEDKNIFIDNIKMKENILSSDVFVSL